MGEPATGACATGVAFAKGTAFATEKAFATHAFATGSTFAEGGPAEHGAAEAALATRGLPGGLRRLCRSGLMPLADLAALVLAHGLVAALALVFGPGVVLPLPGTLILVLPLLWLGGLYRPPGWEGEEPGRMAAAVLLLALVDCVLQGGVDPVSLTGWAGFALLAPFLRDGLRGVCRGLLAEPALLIGTGISPAELAFQMRGARGLMLDLAPGPGLAGLAGLSPPALAARLDQAVRAAGLAPAGLRLILAPGPGEAALVPLLARGLERAGLAWSLLLPEMAEARAGLVLRRLPGVERVLAEQGRAGPGWPASPVKRGADVLLGLLLLLLAAPAMLVIAALLRAEGGPVLFAQTRVGQGRRRFRCLKFRSMLPDAEARLAGLLATDPVARAEWESHQKLARDPRITRVGAFLRRTSLDELPQLFNVIRGEMSLVGPRPVVAPEVPGYAADRAYAAAPGFEAYAACRPGITGLWQVSGRAATRHEERVRLDGWYARNASPAFDLLILMRTLGVVLGRQGAG